MTALPLVLLLDDQGRVHLAVALAEHRRRLRRDHLVMPDSLEQLAATLGLPAAASSGQQRQDFDEVVRSGDADGVLLDTATTARALGVSERTVRRLIAERAIPSMTVGRARRIHRDDLDAYLRDQRAPHLRTETSA